MAEFNFGEVILNSYLKSQADTREQERYAQEAQFRERQFQTQVEQYKDNKDFQEKKFKYEQEIQSYDQTMREAGLLLQQEQSDIAYRNSNLNEKIALQNIRDTYTTNPQGLKLKSTTGKEVETQFGRELFENDNEPLYRYKDVQEGLDAMGRRQQSGALDEARKLDYATKIAALKKQGFGYNKQTGEVYELPQPETEDFAKPLTDRVNRIISKTLGQGMSTREAVFGDYINATKSKGMKDYPSEEEFYRSRVQTDDPKNIIARIDSFFVPAKKMTTKLEKIITSPKSASEVASIPMLIKNLEYLIQTTRPATEEGGVDAPGLLEQIYQDSKTFGYRNTNRLTDIVDLQRRLGIINMKLQGNKKK